MKKLIMSFKDEDNDVIFYRRIKPAQKGMEWTVKKKEACHLTKPEVDFICHFYGRDHFTVEITE